MADQQDKSGVDLLPQDTTNLNDMIKITGAGSVSDPASMLGDSHSNILLWPTAEDIDWPAGADPNDPKDTDPNDKFSAFKGSQSLLNDYHLINIKGINGNNYPKFETEQSSNPNLYKELTAMDLIKNPVGANIYKAADFLYCSRYGQVPMNKMITLRRFAFPVPDDIFNKLQTEPDAGRLITFMDDDINPMTEVFKMDWGFRWRELAAAAQTVSMNGTETGTNAFMRMIMDGLDPKLGREKMLGENRLNFNPLYDNNKVYGPVDSIANTRIRDIGLDYGFEVNLTFDYTLRSINGINAKTAMLDVISNVLAVTNNNAKFWGGARYWVGRRPSQFLNSLKFMHARQFDEFLRGGMEEIRGVIGRFDGGKGPQEALKILKQIAVNALNINFGKVMDAIGRPSIPVFDSLLKNEPLGEWHLTVGNPQNPMFCIGNLTIDRTSMEVDNGILGNDDFPTKIKFIITLKPQMPRDKSGIESIFNAGKGRTYWKPKSIQTINKRFNPTKGSDNLPTNKISTTTADPFKFAEDAIQRNFPGIFDFIKGNGRYEHENDPVPKGNINSTKQKSVQPSTGTQVKTANQPRVTTGIPAIDNDNSEKNPFKR